jgi:Fe-S oxidoreductase
MLPAFIPPLSLPAVTPTTLFRIVFAIILVLSGWSFCDTLRRRLPLAKARKGDLPHDRPAMRLWRVFTEVIFQTRVIRDRPVVGVLHALVMWGFFAFLWVSLGHLSLGFRGLEHARVNPGWYASFAAVWAVAVLAGITGLSFRRFILRPKALGDLSPTSAAVAALIGLLMVTYLLGWGAFPVGSLAWKTNWWAHTLSFFTILVVIPNSKHLHLLLGPVAVFFRSTHTSGLRPLRDDDDLGMVRFNDLSWRDVLQLSACVECGRCSDACPAHTVGKSLNPKQVILGMQRGLLSGGELIAGSECEVASRIAWITERDLGQCLTCGACEAVCPVGIEHVGGKIIDLRRGLVSEGRIANQKLAGFFAAMERQPRNPWGMSRQARSDFLEAEDFPLFDGSQEWLFWLGCGLSYDPHGRSVARAMKDVLDAAGVSWGVLERESCCGEPARRAGNEYLFLQLAEELTETLRQNGVKKLVTCCPHCTSMLDGEYRQLPAYARLGIAVRHHSEFLAALLPELELAPVAETVTYHDPCYLARARGLVEEPRAILSACGATVIEMRHRKSRTFCCGAGGGQIFIEDDRQEACAERVNHRRFAEVVATGAQTVAVACPYCPITLRDAANHADRDDMAILDIAEFVANRLRKEGSERCMQRSFTTPA